MEKYRMGANMKDKQMEDQYATSIQQTFASLIKSIKTNKEQNLSFFSLVSFNIQQKYYRTSKMLGRWIVPFGKTMDGSMHVPAIVCSFK